MYIMNEIACDYDIEWSSFHMNVDFGANAMNNLLRFEAPWDFDSGLGVMRGLERLDKIFSANVCTNAMQAIVCRESVNSESIIAV